jgi:hypothetical protein
VGILVCRRCGCPIMPNGCPCDFDPRAVQDSPGRAVRESYAKPLGPRPLSVPATCLVLGFMAGVLVGLIGSAALRWAW